MSVDLLNMFPIKSASGSVASFKDGTALPFVSAIAEIRPSQNLNGFDHPWPAGGGKNLLPKGVTSEAAAITFTVANDGRVSASGIASGNAFWAVSFTIPAGTYILSGCPKGGGISTYSIDIRNAFHGTPISGISADEGNGSRFTVESELSAWLNIKICDGYDASSGLVFSPMIRLASATNAAFVPYSNVCPISTKTEANIYVSGKNLLRNQVFIVGENTLYVGQNANGYRVYMKAGTYTFSMSKSRPGGAYFRGENDSANTGIISLTNPAGVSFGTFTLTYDGMYRFGIAYAGGLSASDIEWFQVEVGNVATEYEAYNGGVYAVSWNTQTGGIYGGLVDAVDGGLVSNWRLASFDGTETWAFSTSGGKKRVATTARLVGVQTGDFLTDVVSNYLNIQQDTYPDPWCFVISPTGTLLIGVPDSITSASDWQTYLGSNQLDVAYKSMSSSEYELSPVIVNGVVGETRVLSDAGGDMGITYNSDTSLAGRLISAAFVDGNELQENGWFLEWRELSAPVEKTNYTSIPGRDGDIDRTDALGKVFYEDRLLSMNMVYNGNKWEDELSDLLDDLHGQRCVIQFTDDPYWYHVGRISVSGYSSKDHKLVATAKVYPYKLKITEESVQASVSGVIQSNAKTVILPGSRMEVSPKIVVTGTSVSLAWGGNTATLSPGTQYVTGLIVGKDDVTISVWGTGTVTFSYRKGRL